MMKAILCILLLLAISCVSSQQSCSTAANCDDHNPCTVDTCVNNICQYANSANGSSCDDNLWCNGKDVCLSGVCQHLGDPCARGAICGNVCDESTNSCIAPKGSSCDDGVFCNGADKCDGNGNCVSSGDPCAAGTECNNMCSEGARTCQTPAGTNCTAGYLGCSDLVAKCQEGTCRVLYQNCAITIGQANLSARRPWFKTPVIVAPILGGIAVLVVIAIIIAIITIKRQRRSRPEAKIGLETGDYDGGDSGFGSVARLPNTGGVTGTSMMLTPVMTGSPQNSPFAVRRAVAYSAKAAERVRMESAARSIEEIEIGGSVGPGNFGEVLFGKWHQPQANGTPAQIVEVALKKLHRPDKFDTFKHEVEILRELSHTNIVRYFGVFADHNQHEMYLATEYMSRGSVIDLLHIMKDKITEDKLVEVTLGAALGMAYLERLRIVHRDLNCRNLLVTTSENGHHVVKVSDFGNAVCLAAEDEDFVANDVVLHPAWSAVEVLRDNLFSSKSDVWSFGVCMWEIFEKGREPFAEVSKLQVAEKIMRGERLERPEGCADDLYDVMSKCWEESPSDRPSFQQVLDLICGAMQRRGTGEAERREESEGDASEEEEEEKAARALRGQQSQTEADPEDEETL